ncbi:TraX family protein [Eubacterium sp.]|uniref:TraX family protein n=2 Tax=Eubacterium sp. TaxID=142586 RepID=UPI00260927C8|nr:TraX family protein [Eubacterium sp.]MDD7331367.1 TraX family protein [Eubacterium sp.]MDY3812248.1 TraX family protein [Eubacterium sp.]
MTKSKILNSNQLKLIAIIAMTVDHIAWAMFDGYPSALLPLVMHIIGRLTCPIMCYFIAEGYHYTRNINKYTFRLFAFAFVSHFAYIFASNDFVDFKSFIPFYYGNFLNQTSVMWSLAWGLVMLRIADSKRIKSIYKVLLVILICIITLSSDWSCIAALCIMAIGTNRGDFRKQMSWMIFYVALYSLVYFFAIDKAYGILQMGVVLSIPVIAMYNGKRGKNPKINKFMKWFFYIFYPVHLFVIGLINYFS